MKTEYDLAKMKSRKNPYATKLKKSVTMRLAEMIRVGNVPTLRNYNFLRTVA